MTKAFCDITTPLENRLKLTETVNTSLLVAMRLRNTLSHFELQKRRLPYTAIDWSTDQQANTPPKSDVIFDRNPEASAAESAEAMAAEPVEAAESDVCDPVHPIDQADPIDLTDQAVDRVDPIDPADQAVEPVDAVEQLKRRIEAFMNSPGRSN